MNASLLVLSLASFSAAAPQDVLYDFYSTNCGPCQAMMPMVTRLHAEGLPIVKVNVNERPDLAERYGVQYVPTFILVIGGTERQRVSGMQEESTLRAMLAQIPKERPTRQLPVRFTDDEENKGKWNFHLPLPPFGSKKTNAVQIDEVSNGTSSGRIRGVKVEPEKTDDAQSEEAPQDRVQPPDPAVARMLSSSVRIKVKDANGVYYGSGVLIDSAPGKSIVLTCGHVLRDVKKGTRIDVDVFDGKYSRTYHGTIVKFDLDADVGLVAIPTQTILPSSSVAGLDEAVRVHDPVVSIGCSSGELPTVEQLRVTTLNRYLGPDTVECTGVPVQGRSGGGLFTTQGHVVGICTNADPKEKRGVYAGLRPIHDLLRSADLEDLIPVSSHGPRDLLAGTRHDDSDLVAADTNGHTKLESELTQMSRARGKRSVAQAQETSLAVAKGDEVTGKVFEEAEVICIVRPLNQPKSASRVVIINKASRKFMAYLTDEMKEQLTPTMGTFSTDESADPAAGPTQKTEAWKPTGGRKYSGTTKPPSPNSNVPDDERSWRETSAGNVEPPVETRPTRRYVRSAESEQD